MESAKKKMEQYGPLTRGLNGYDRQRACSKACSGKLRKKTQGAWRGRHPEYGIAQQIAKRARRIRADRQ
jgi:hypothetical protein